MNVNLLGWSVPFEDWLAYEAALLEAAGYDKTPSTDEEPIAWMTFGHTIPWQVCESIGDRIEEVGAEADEILREAVCAKLAYCFRVHGRYKVNITVRALN